ncbi:UNKNOWN [Stylonychia lemnae]|uniref:Uncharacterized protein n=1 Tax=Stylonychia lemnae TaxID=5949 RepID=A0A078AGD8_STYLE|nr:UNKNOWN [Stylonychia lemnae]|eukprot:CDW81304.1 UNKNOWN [Stylonychia lemnae]
MTVEEFKAIAFKDLPNKENSIIKMIYQDLKINPYIHANIVQMEQSQVVDEEAGDNSVAENPNQLNFDNLDVLTDYLRVLEEQQANLRSISNRMRQDVSITRPRRPLSTDPNQARRVGNNGRANRFANRLSLRNRFRAEPRVVYFGGSTQDGTCIDFIWGFLLGFIFPLIFVIMVLLCRTKKLAKTGVLLGYFCHVYLYYSSLTQSTSRRATGAT